jgi:hypothetical protein
MAPRQKACQGPAQLRRWAPSPDPGASPRLCSPRAAALAVCGSGGLLTAPAPSGRLERQTPEPYGPDEDCHDRHLLVPVVHWPPSYLYRFWSTLGPSQPLRATPTCQPLMALMALAPTVMVPASEQTFGRFFVVFCQRSRASAPVSQFLGAINCPHRREQLRLQQRLAVGLRRLHERCLLEGEPSPRHPVRQPRVHHRARDAPHLAQLEAQHPTPARHIHHAGARTQSFSPELLD